MVWLSTVIVLALATTTLADETCKGTSMLAKTQAIRKEDPGLQDPTEQTEEIEKAAEGTSTDVIEAEVEQDANLDFENYTSPEVLRLQKLSKDQQGVAQKQLTEAGDRNFEDDHFVQLAKEAKEKAHASGVAAISHASAQKAHKAAKDLALEAARAKAASLKADEDAGIAKEKYELLLSTSLDKAKDALRANDAFKESEVVEETNKLAAKRLTAEKEVAKQKVNSAKVEKKEADDLKEDAKRAHDKTTYELKKVKELQTAKTNAFDKATGKRDTAARMAQQAMNSLTVASHNLGHMKAKTAEEEVKEVNSEQLREVAGQNYNLKVLRSHEAMEATIESEAKANATRDRADTMTNTAKYLSQFAVDSSTVGWYERGNPKEEFSAEEDAKIWAAAPNSGVINHADNPTTLETEE